MHNGGEKEAGDVLSGWIVRVVADGRVIDAKGSKAGDGRSRQGQRPARLHGEAVRRRGFALALSRAVGGSSFRSDRRR